MKTDDFNILLKRYYEGKTSEREEEQIRDFLRGKDIPEDLVADKLLFEALSSFKRPDIPDDLDKRISAAIDRQASKRRNRLLGLVACAAVILGIMFSTDVLFEKSTKQSVVSQNSVNCIEKVETETKYASNEVTVKDVTSDNVAACNKKSFHKRQVKRSDIKIVRDARDSEEALKAAQQTERALLALSSALKKGRDEINMMDEKTAEINCIVREQIQKLNNR